MPRPRLDVTDYDAMCDFCTEAKAVFELSEMAGGRVPVLMCRLCLKEIVHQLSEIVERATIRKKILEN